MRAIEYLNKAGQKRFKQSMTEDEYREVEHDSTGACLGCGEEAYGVEPDARRYHCDGCGQDLVYGLQELLLMNLIRFE